MRKWGIILAKRFKLLLLTGILSIAALVSGCSNIAVLDPKGPVAKTQSGLIMYSIIFMLVIVVVIMILLAVMLVKYRERTNLSNYEPNMHGSLKLEVIWTVIPVLIVIALTVPTVKAIYSLEKAPSVTKDQKPLVIHATSADWKWFFSYEDSDIETVNYVNIPVNRPVEFKLVAADTMTSFWVPQLGGQKYAMTGMQMDLFLQADHEGTYKGRNANFNGRGFEGQKFDVVAQSDADFNAWIKKSQKAPKLTQDKYDKMLIPGHEEVQTFSGTHLGFANHVTDPEYVFYAWKRYNYIPLNPHNPNQKQELSDTPLLPARSKTITNARYTEDGKMKHGPTTAKTSQ